MSAVSTPALRDVRQSWVRALWVAGGAAAAAIVWAIEVPLLGVRLSIRFGAMHPETVVAGQVVGAALVAALLGWLLLTILERRTPRSRAAWTGAALLVLVISLALPLAAATTASAVVGLIALHLAVGAVVIPGMSYTARRPGR
jgi:predicted permease